VMAPLTRSRAGDGDVATPLMAEYYRQRASAGLIITEATYTSLDGRGYLNTPGICTPDQIESWRQVTDAVHAERGRVFSQLVHCGRVSHPDLLPAGRAPLAPSAIAAPAKVWTANGFVPCGQPREMSRADIDRTVAEFAAAASAAVSAGFDGVELHAVNGFLVHQFLAANTNRRTDPYGGSLTNRIRFAVTVVEAMADAVGARRVAVRIAPGSGLNGVDVTDDDVLYPALVAALPRNLAYLHVREASYGRQLTERLRSLWVGPLVLNPHPATESVGGPFDDGPFSGGGPFSGMVTASVAEQALDEGVADLLAFGSMFLSNPDLPARIAAGGPYNEPAERATWYGGDARGYTDYPSLMG